MKFEKGMQVIVTNPFYKNYKKGDILTLVDRKRLYAHEESVDEYNIKSDYYWTVQEGGVGIAEDEMEPGKITNWRKVLK